MVRSIEKTGTKIWRQQARVKFWKREMPDFRDRPLSDSLRRVMIKTTQIRIKFLIMQLLRMVVDMVQILFILKNNKAMKIARCFYFFVFLNIFGVAIAQEVHEKNERLQYYRDIGLGESHPKVIEAKKNNPDRDPMKDGDIAEHREGADCDVSLLIKVSDLADKSKEHEAMVELLDVLFNGELNEKIKYVRPAKGHILVVVDQRFGAEIALVLHRMKYRYAIQMGKESDFLRHLYQK